MKWQWTPTNSPLPAVAWRQPLRNVGTTAAGSRIHPNTPDPTQVALAELIEQGCTHLQAYQNQALADTYRAFVQRVQDAETRLETGKPEPTPDPYRRCNTPACWPARMNTRWRGSTAMVRWRLRWPSNSAATTASTTTSCRSIMAIRHSAGRAPTKVRLGSWTHAALRALAGSALCAPVAGPVYWLDQRRRERNVAAQYRAFAGTGDAQDLHRITPIRSKGRLWPKAFGVTAPSARRLHTTCCSRQRHLLTKADIRLG